MGEIRPLYNAHGSWLVLYGIGVPGARLGKDIVIFIFHKTLNVDGDFNLA